jgi:hypothetical protein
MSLETTFGTVMDRLKAQLDVSQPSLEVAWPNVRFSPNKREAWIRPTMLPGESRQASNGSTGNKRYRTPGVVMVQVFVPVGAGDEPGLAICDDVISAMRGVTVSGVRLRTPSTQRVGTSDAWIQWNVSTPFEFDVFA